MPGDRHSVVRLYGQEVRQFSSQYSAEERMSYAAQNLAGESNIYPNYGDFTQACVFRTYGPWWRMLPSAPKPFRKTPEPHRLACEDFIEVVFSQRLYPVAVHVYETYNPGAIVRIMGCDHQAGTSVDTGRHNMWRTLWSGPPVETSRKVRIFSPPIRRLDTPVNSIRLELNHSLLHYYTELDCIMLLGVTAPPTPQLYPILQAQANNHPEGYPCEWEKEVWVGVEGGGGEGGEEGERQQVIRRLESLSLDEKRDKDDLREEKKSPSTCGDEDHIFARMPEEIIVMIMGYLDFPSLGCLAQTCRLLQKHAYDCILYTEINLQPMWNMVTDNTLAGLACRCHHLQRLSMSWCRDDHAKYTPGFKRLLQVCADTLTILHLSCCSFVNQDTLYVIATTCSKLKDLDLSGCEEVDKVSAIHLTQLTELERLNLYRTQVDTHAFICIIRRLNKLKHLNFGSCKLLSNNSQVLEELGQHCPDLLSVDMWRARNMDNTSFIHFVQKCRKLQELDLGWCTDLHSHGECFTTLAEQCKDLKKLFLTANRSVCNRDLLALAKFSKDLEQLDLLGTREISVDAVEKVLESCKKLVMIDVSFCANIVEDNVETWKVKFPHVTVKKSFQH